ncbi:MAG TPA: PEP-CTERM sorting domain-containing protein [Chthoniobacterales bacterium]|jgi:hypothetical protein|nr:PEP-CTERM sorting domain-containing protein [Chthoniobacterales bacterium]
MKRAFVRWLGQVALGLFVCVCAFDVGNAQIVANGSFETPDIPSNSFVYDPSGASWIFTGSSGIIDSPGAAFFGPPAPDGSQYAFLQFDPMTPGVFSETITLSLDGTYRLSYVVAGRPSNGGGAGGDLPYQIRLDSTIVASDATTTGQPFTARVFDFFATSGTHTLTFETAPGASGDNTAFFDSVAIQPVPEPATAALFVSGLLAVVATARRKNQ